MIARRGCFPAASLARFARRRFAKLKRIKYTWRKQLSEATPSWAGPLFWRAACHFDMLVLDHGVFRLAYVNQHPVGCRSSRPNERTLLASQRGRAVGNRRSSSCRSATAIPALVAAVSSTCSSIVASTTTDAGHAFSRLGRGGLRSGEANARVSASTGMATASTVGGGSATGLRDRDSGPLRENLPTAQWH
jgi:hypothetical protein